ncbi:MAG: hypothetical protein U5K00_24560 [Melioribacteraceae bacterium]|nr:hypothetical protein [Melioribacteraceae bacterium]
MKTKARPCLPFRTAESGFPEDPLDENVLGAFAELQFIEVTQTWTICNLLEVRPRLHIPSMRLQLVHI